MARNDGCVVEAVSDASVAVTPAFDIDKRRFGVKRPEREPASKKNGPATTVRETPRLRTDPFTIIEPTKEQIRERAYLLYLGRNGGPGSADGDWLEAERQLRCELSGR